MPFLLLSSLPIIHTKMAFDGPKKKMSKIFRRRKHIAITHRHPQHPSPSTAKLGNSPPPPPYQHCYLHWRAGIEATAAASLSFRHHLDTRLNVWDAGPASSAVVASVGTGASGPAPCPWPLPCNGVDAAYRLSPLHQPDQTPSQAPRADAGGKDHPAPHHHARGRPSRRLSHPQPRPRHDAR